MKGNKTQGEKSPVKENNKERGQPKFYAYQGFATEKEREKMTSFLQDEFVNLMLLSRFHVNLDKFQVKDILNKLNNKANQDNALRKEFYAFLHTGVPRPKQIIAFEDTSPVITKMNQGRKLSTSLLSDRSDKGKSPEKFELDRRQNTNEDDKNKIKRKRNYSKGNIKTARSDEGDKESKDKNEVNIKGGQEKMMMQMIRLMKEKTELNEKLNKAFNPQIQKNEKKEVIKITTTC